MRRSQIALLAVAAAVVAFSIVNASWLSSAPTGPLIVVAHRGVVQPFDRAEVGDCSARHVRATGHMFIENTIFSMQAAISFGARALMLDVHASADGRAMIFRDADLGCRTNGTGRVRDRPMAYLATLDVGYGYSPDGGASFPLRGRGVGGMPTAEEVLRRVPTGTTLIFTLSEPRDADALLADFARASVAVSDLHGFAGPPEALGRLRQLTRAGWTIDRQAGDACLSGYRATGWFGQVPNECRGATVIVPRRGEWTLWGWPYRFMNRLTGAGARLFIQGDAPPGAFVGLEQAEQIGEVPRSYRGLLLIEDMHDVGRALGR
ncbi:MAG TPA: glycerophosphodiester phosphodiesterase family protein [Allosphingosinicella sp.]|nr:glycerophosphodiester phosphodiesterase family protein [Allosphingosinicella sp.]